jgi:hypothetical protein
MLLKDEGSYAFSSRKGRKQEGLLLTTTRPIKTGIRRAGKFL